MINDAVSSILNFIIVACYDVFGRKDTEKNENKNENNK